MLGSMLYDQLLDWSVALKRLGTTALDLGSLAAARVTPAVFTYTWRVESLLWSCNTYLYTVYSIPKKVIMHQRRSPRPLPSFLTLPEATFCPTPIGSAVSQSPEQPCPP